MLGKKAQRRLAVMEGVNKDEAEKIKKQIEDAGGTVELK